MADLRVELLYTADCPNYGRVRVELQRILGHGAIETPIQLVLVEDLEAAQILDFRGSPTVRVNGLDVVPPPESLPVSLACRLYGQSDGSRSGLVPSEAMQRAVDAHRQRRLEAFRRDESARVAAAAREAAADEDDAGAASEDGDPR